MKSYCYHTRLAIILCSLFVLSGCVVYQESDLNSFDTKVLAAPQVVASDGYYRNKILLCWKTINHASYYDVQKSEDGGTTFQKVYRVYANEIGTLVKNGVVSNDPDDDGDDTTTVITPGEYTSNIDLSSGLTVAGDLGTGWSETQMSITINGSIAGTVTFSGGTWGRTYDRDEVLTLIHDAISANDDDYETHFQGTDDGKYITIYADKTIILKNAKTAVYSPLSTFIEEGIDKNAEITVSPTIETVTSTTTTTTTTTEDYNIQENLFYLLDVDVVNGTKYIYKVISYTSSDDYITETETDEGFSTSSTAPGAATGLGVTRGQESITITWDGVADATSYRIYRYKLTRLDKTESYSMLADGITDTTYTEDVGNVEPGMYYYKIAAFNNRNEEGAHTSPEYGYRAITDTEFLLEYHKEVMLSQKKFTLMHKDGLSALGKETIEGNITGTGYFTSSGSLSGAEANVTYTSYCDSYLTLTGYTIQDIPDIWGKNGTMTGTDYIGSSTCDDVEYSTYRGNVEYFLDIKSAQAGGGYYIVRQEVNGTTSETRAEWTVIRDWDAEHPEYQP